MHGSIRCLKQRDLFERLTDADAALQAYRAADRVLVVDGGSRDRTTEIARE